MALSVFCLTRITLNDFNLENDLLTYFIFFSTILSYNFIRIFQLYRIKSKVAAWIRAERIPLIILNGISILVLVPLSLLFEFNDFLVLLPFVLATVFYVLPSSYKFKGLRNIAGLKLFLIAFTWAGITVFFPLYVNKLPYSELIGLVFIQRFLFVMAITIPFDIRDAKFDLPDLGTLPQVLGVNKAKIVACTALVLFVMLELYKVSSYGGSPWIPILVAALSGIFILGTHENRNRYYTAFWVESIPIMWFLANVFVNDSMI